MTRLLLWTQTPAQCWQKAVSVLEGPSFTGLILLSVFLKKNVVYLDVIFFFILCKLVVRYFIIHKLSSGLGLCEFWICHSFKDSRYSVNINCEGEQAGDVLLTHSFAHFLSGGGCSSKALLKFIFSYFKYVRLGFPFTQALSQGSNLLIPSVIQMTCSNS